MEVRANRLIIWLISILIYIVFYFDLLIKNTDNNNILLLMTIFGLFVDLAFAITYLFYVYEGDKK